MTESLAALLTALTIIAAGTLLTTLILPLLPAHRRTVVPVGALAVCAIASVAFGTEIAQTLPQRIVAKHEAADAYARVQEKVPELAGVADKDPLIGFELSAAFHNAYMAQDGSAAVRAQRAGQSLGLVVQQAFVRDAGQIPDEAARRIIAIERAILETQAATDPRACRAPVSVAQVRHAAPTDRHLRDLFAAEFRTKLQALSEGGGPLPAFKPAQRAMFEAQLFARAGPAAQSGLEPERARCRRMIGFYAALQQQPVSLQGRWLRSRQALSISG